MNGKAIDLVKPVYPPAARHVGVRGLVRLSVLIDPRGCVSEATAVSGHPLLLQASLQAATKSSFTPTSLSGKPIWINGFIIYHFISDRQNWLEMGFTSDSSAKLIAFLPPEYDRLRNELKAAALLPFNERQKAVSAILETIRVELTPDAKHQWLFDVGQIIKAISRNQWLPGGRDETFRRLQYLIEIVPPAVSPQLVIRLNRIAISPRNNTLLQELSDLEDRMFQIGN